MAIPEYCDSRAKQFFHYVFVGTKHGETKCGHSWSWSSTSGAKPTAVHVVDNHAVYCAYCGNEAYPIQNDIPDSYDTTGYCCVCKDAMDEIEWRAEYNELLCQQAMAREALLKKAPMPTKEATNLVVERRVARLRKDIEADFFSKRAMDKLGVSLGHPHNYFKRED